MGSSPTLWGQYNVQRYVDPPQISMAIPNPPLGLGWDEGVGVGGWACIKITGAWHSKSWVIPRKWVAVSLGLVSTDIFFFDKDYLSQKLWQ